MSDTNNRTFKEIFKEKFNANFNPSNKETHEISKTRKSLLALYFFFDFLYLLLTLILAGLFIQHDPLDNSDKLPNKSANAGFSKFYMAITIIYIILKCFVVMNVIVGGGYLKSDILRGIIWFMLFFQSLLGLALCSLVINIFTPDKNNPRKIPPHSGTYMLAQATIVLLFIHFIASFTFIMTTVKSNS